MPFERQVNLYLNAIDKMQGNPAEVLYNVVRRPGLRQGKFETTNAFVKRIADDVGNRPDWYFFRLKMTVERRDLQQFDQELTAVLSAFAGWQRGEIGSWKNSDACENKYGVCPYIKKCANGETTGLYKRSVVFRELEDMV
jgi:hypothetical protein